MYQFQTASKCFSWIAAFQLLIASNAVSAAESCEESRLIEPIGVWHSNPKQSLESHRYRVDIESSGIVRIDVSTSSSLAIAPSIDDDPRCDLGTQEFLTIDSSPTHRTLAFRGPTSYNFQITGEKPQDLSLDEYQIYTSFSPAVVIEEELQLNLDTVDERARVRWTEMHFGSRKSDDDIDEVDPGPGAKRLARLDHGPTLSWLSFSSLPKTKSDDDIDEVDPGPGFADCGPWRKSDDDIDEVDPGPGFSDCGPWRKSDDDIDEVDPGPGAPLTSGDPAADSQYLGRLWFFESAHRHKSDDDIDEVDPGPGKHALGTELRFESADRFDPRQAALLVWIAETLAPEGLSTSRITWSSTIR
ncbi:MAG: hypothetical protein AAF560_13835 [Acidobacteriota bacterium]